MTNPNPFAHLLTARRPTPGAEGADAQETAAAILAAGRMRRGEDPEAAAETAKRGGKN